MAYIDYAYYSDTYKGTAITQGQFNVLAERASDLIDMITSHALNGGDLTQQPQLIQNNVKKATAAQVEYLLMQGGETAAHGGSPASVSIGNFNYQEGAEKASIISPAVAGYLRVTGLLYRGVNVCD